jgi:hypothetical protein
MENKFSSLEKIVRKFEERFTPSMDIYGSSELYFDFENKCVFYPNADQLQECMNEYAKMINHARGLSTCTDDADEASSWMLFNSELLLGYLIRSSSQNIKTCKDSAQIIADGAKHLLVKAGDSYLDQYARLITIGNLLSEYGIAEFSYREEDSKPDNGIDID